MTLFTVTLHGRAEPLIIEAATADVDHGWWVFRNADGSSLATLPAADVRRIETARLPSEQPGRRRRTN